MKRRFEAYKSKIVKLFFRDHFAKLDRQIVLVDVLKSLSDSPDAVADLERAMGVILTVLRSSRRGFLKKVLRGKRIDCSLFVALKADHLHHRQHSALTAMVEALTQAARDKARFSGALTAAISVGAPRSTVEVELGSNSRALRGVKGLVQSGGKNVGFYPGEFPKSPASVSSLVSGVGPPHIRLDKAVEFLIGDLL